jgi:ABC-2 type transport system permease protein
MTVESPASAAEDAGSRSTAAAIGWRGVRTMAEHEFRLRLRAGRWRWLLAAWFVTLLVVFALSGHTGWPSTCCLAPALSP